MSNAYALKTAKELNALVQADPTQAQPVLAYLDACIKAGRRRTKPSQSLHAKLTRMVSAPEPAPAPAAPVADVPKARKAAAPKPDADEALRARVEAGLTASREAFLAAFFAK